MKKEVIISGLIGVLIGVLVSALFFGMWWWNPIGWGPMIGGGDFDRHFIEQMTPHHNDAVLMAEIALEKAEHQEVKTLAADIKLTQTEENKKMGAWYKLWFGQDVPDTASGMRMGHGIMMKMHGGMMGDTTDITKFESAKPFDREFIEQMIPHHQMAVMMATMLLPETEREEMRTLAQAIIGAQSREIDQMRSWYRNWYGQ